MKFTGIAATTHEMTDRAMRFTDEDLELMAKQINDPESAVPLTLNFDRTLPPLGKAVSAEVTADGLRVVVELFDGVGRWRLPKTMFAVPGVVGVGVPPVFKVQKVFELGITGEPVDTTLTPLVEVERDEVPPTQEPAAADTLETLAAGAAILSALTPSEPEPAAASPDPEPVPEPTPEPEQFEPGGGSFGGAGASASWDEPSAPSPEPSEPDPPDTSSSDTSSGSSDSGGGGDAS